MQQLHQVTACFYTALDTRDWPCVEQLVTDDFTASVGDAPPAPFAVWRRQLEAFHAGFPDGHHVIDRFVVAEDTVVTRCRFQGTHAGTFHRIRPTGRGVSAGVIHIDEFRNGRIARHHGQLNMAGLLDQLQRRQPVDGHGDPAGSR